MDHDRPRFRGFDERGRLSVSRHHLPHWTQAGTTYFVTFHLGDSLPVGQLREWREQRSIWLDLHPRPWTRDVEDEYATRFGDKIDTWLDAGMGACHLRRPPIRHEVEACLLHFDRQRYDLDAFVIMPNHVHALMAPREGSDLFDLLRGIKGASARACNLRLGRTGESFWMEDNYNRIVRDAEELGAFRRYIAENPDKARLPESDYTLAARETLLV